MLAKTESMTNHNDTGSPDAGDGMYSLARRLFPYHRSITGPGVRQTLQALQDEIPLQIREIPTGSVVFDWEVPREWHVRDAYIADEANVRLVDIATCNLHIAGYSRAVDRTMPWSKLKSHLITDPAQPEWVPFRSNHFEDDWSFCLSHRQYLELEDRGERDYHVVVDAEFVDGSLSYGELFVRGECEDEVLISTHVCHPSMANDNLSGIVVSTWLAKAILDTSRRMSYRFIFIPATIGAIAWLAVNEDTTRNIRHGLVLSGVGDDGDITYKRSRRESAEVDRAVAHVLQSSGDAHRIRDFEPFGYDERQFCSPGFDLPMGCFMRTPNGEYAEYHTSGDNLDFISPSQLADSLAKLRRVLDVLDANRKFRNLKPKCEPRLGQYGLYEGFGRSPDRVALQRAVQWVLNLSDGSNSLLEIAERSGVPFEMVSHASGLLVDCGLLAETTGKRPETRRSKT